MARASSRRPCICRANRACNAVAGVSPRTRTQDALSRTPERFLAATQIRGYVGLAIAEPIMQFRGIDLARTLPERASIAMREE